MLAVSAAGLLVRVADAHPLALAFWRTAIVAVLLAPWARRVARKDLLWIALGGALLALHFWVWFVSLRMTTVLRSTVLVCLTPVWAGLGEALLLGAPPPRRFWVGVGIALVGIAGMAGGGGQGSWAGDALAVGGGMLSAAYLLVGRVIRPRVDIATYGAFVCGAAAIVLLGLAGVLGAPLVAHASWGAILGLALGPQLLGHVGFNYALRYVPAATIGAVILLEPVGATLLAAVVLRELPTPSELLAGLLVLGGLLIGARAEARPHAG